MPKNNTYKATRNQTLLSLNIPGS